MSENKGKIDIGNNDVLLRRYGDFMRHRDETIESVPSLHFLSLLTLTKHVHISVSKPFFISVCVCVCFQRFYIFKTVLLSTWISIIK